MVFLVDDVALRGYMAQTAPLEPTRAAVPSAASRCLRRWCEGAHDDDLFFFRILPRPAPVGTLSR